MEPVTYPEYLGLDTVLSAQHPRSEEHDEMLFIIVHQVYELWFKQLLHEGRHLSERLEAGDGPRSLHTLKRMLTILKVAVAQVDVIETMTPRQFTGFRARLDTASGFQSAQFRRLEVLLGRRDEGLPRSDPALANDVGRRPVFDSYLRYLEVRHWPVPEEVLHRNPAEPYEGAEGVQQLLLTVYEADGEEAQVAERLVDLDEGLQEWRYRHVKMVERTIGDKPGTGGSSGAGYLRSTLFRPVFPDLWAVRPKL
ncbi:MAG TPA: tryptophan 2,3-dioxygenase family protein [Acidimicrobiales bacterium]|nr:tryptophan 2,3-dioxygenase family protein [Acidimicrobiales bacterium]